MQRAPTVAYRPWLWSTRGSAREGAHHFPVGIPTVPACFLAQRGMAPLTSTSPFLYPQTKSGPPSRSSGRGATSEHQLTWGLAPSRAQRSPPMKAQPRKEPSLTAATSPAPSHGEIPSRYGKDQRVSGVLSPMGGTTVLGWLPTTPRPHLTFEGRALQTLGLPEAPAYSGHQLSFVTNPQMLLLFSLTFSVE